MPFFWCNSTAEAAWTTQGALSNEVISNWGDWTDFNDSLWVLQKKGWGWPRNWPGTGRSRCKVRRQSGDTRRSRRPRPAEWRKQWRWSLGCGSARGASPPGGCRLAWKWAPPHLDREDGLSNNNLHLIKKTHNTDIKPGWNEWADGEACTVFRLTLRGVDVVHNVIRADPPVIRLQVLFIKPHHSSCLYPGHRHRRHVRRVGSLK